MPGDPDRATTIFAALGDEKRLALVGRLCAEGPLSISQLTAGSAVTRQAITKHLTVLAGAGIVTFAGLFIVWRERQLNRMKAVSPPLV